MTGEKAKLKCGDCIDEGCEGNCVKGDVIRVALEFNVKANNVNIKTEGSLIDLVAILEMARISVVRQLVMADIKVAVQKSAAPKIIGATTMPGAK